MKRAGMIDRRAVLAAGAALAARSAQAQAPDRELDAALDSLAAPGGESSTPEGAARRRRAASLDLSGLEAVKPEALSAEGRVRRAAVLEGVRAEAALAQLFPFGGPASPYVVHPRGGAHTRVAALLAAGGDARLAEAARQVAGETLRIEDDARVSVIPPRALLSPTLALLDTAQAAARAATGSVAGALASALAAQHATLASLASRAGATPGVWRFPGGETYYALVLSLAAGAPISPQAAHRLGLETVGALRGRADRLLRARGRTHGTVAERLRALARDPRQLYPATDAGKDAAVADMSASLARARAALPRAFADAPKAPVQVRRMSAAEEAARRPGRREAARATTPAGYLVDLSAIGSRPRWTLPSVVHHELQPGHLLQEASARRAEGHPALARYAPGYGEGWAIHAETLADELGLFDADPLGRIGYLQWMLFRFGRLVADTGLHLRRWSRERAIAELREIQGDPVAFITIEEDVDRMIAQPGAVAGQALAALEIMRLREEARRKLGARFDLPDFHDAVLRRGPMGGAGLRGAVELWVASRAA